MKKFKNFLPFLFFIFVQNLFAQKLDLINFSANLTNLDGSEIDGKLNRCETKCYRLQICDLTDSDFYDYLWESEEFHNTCVDNISYTIKGSSSSNVIASFSSTSYLSNTFSNTSTTFTGNGESLSLQNLNDNEIDCENHELCLKRGNNTGAFSIELELHVDVHFVDCNSWSPLQSVPTKVFKFTLLNFPPPLPVAATSLIIGKPGTITKISTLHSTNNGNTPNGFPLLLPNLATTTSQEFGLEGTLEIDEDYTLAKDKKGLSKIIMGSKARILVRSPNILTLYADISGCGEMWDRIEVERGAKIIVADSKIRDGYTAIYSFTSSTSSVGASIRINNSEFTNNYTSLYAYGKSHFIAVTNSKFNNKGGLLKTPYSTKDLPYTGFEIINGASVFVNSNNLFDRLANGIIVRNAKNTTVYSTKNTFTNIGQADNTYDINGNGIYFSASSHSSLTVSDCKFKDIVGKTGTTNSWGVFTSGPTNLTVENISIDEVFHGIDCDDFKEVNINNCTIGTQFKIQFTPFAIPTVYDGIRLTNAYPNSILIENNKVYGNGANLALHNVNNNNDYAKIQLNRFQNHSTDCIFMNNCMNSYPILIHNNTLDNTTNNSSFDINTGYFGKNMVGVNIKRCDNIELRSNTFSSYASAYVSTCGFNHFLASSLLITENSNRILTLCNRIVHYQNSFCEVEDNGQMMYRNPVVGEGPGIYCSDMNNSIIVGNIVSVGSSAIGIELGGPDILMSEQFTRNGIFSGNDDIFDLFDNNILITPASSGTAFKLSVNQNILPFIGKQTHTKNRFSNVVINPLPTAINEGISKQSLFIVNSSADPNYLPATFTPDDWFKDQPGDAEALGCYALKPPKGRCISDVDIDVIRNGLQNEYYGENLDWIMRSRYYYNIRGNSDFECYNKDVESFIDTYTDNSIGKHFEVEKIKRSLFSLTKEEKTSLDKLELQKIEITKKIALLDVKNNEIIDKEGNALIQQLDKIDADIEQLYYNNRVNSIPLVKKAKNLNNATAQDETILPDVNQKLIDDVFLNTTAIGINKFNDAQWKTITSIANQCPYRGGDAVFEARAMYRMRNDSIKFNDTLNCKPIKVGTKIAKNTPISDFKISPNPANNWIKVEFKIEENTTLNITDLTGKLLYTQAILKDDGTQNIELSQFNTGAYFVALLNSKGQTLKIQKLIIAK